MVKEGVLKTPSRGHFGLHINAQTEVGKIKYRSRGTMAASDWFTIKNKWKTNAWCVSMVGY
jgi:metal-dependent amidase/aminoacylase/carboxypeptidase family protein